MVVRKSAKSRGWMRTGRGTPSWRCQDRFTRRGDLKEIESMPIDWVTDQCVREAYKYITNRWDRAEI